MTNRRLAVWRVTLIFFLPGCLQYPPVSTTTSTLSPTEPSSDVDHSAYSPPTSIARVITPALSPVPADTSSPSPSSTRTGKQTLLPVPSSPTSAIIPVFGVEAYQITASGGLDQISQTGTRWLRRNAVVWSDTEPNQGVRVWNLLAGIEAELRNASSRGIQVIMIVRGTPTWAQKVPGSKCGPIRQDKFAAFGNFLRDLVSRYSSAPYNVKYWELWNEPDIDPAVVQSDSVFGCWGDQNDAYYGGGYYAEMLKVVYPQIKAADPQSQVVVGGLLLDCDPRSACAAVGHGDKPPKFLEGILKAGGGSYFDGISFHAYDFYSGELGKYAVPNWKSAWNTTGPTLVAKSNFVKSLLTANGVSAKFLMNTETALLCGSCNKNSTFENTKAFYVAQVYATAIAQGLRANIWYSVLGWQNSGLVDEKMNALPAFNAFKFASMELRGVQPIGEITEYPGVKGYEFNRGDRRIRILWSLDGMVHPITLPRVPLAVYHVEGTPITPTNSLNVTLEPQYLEQSP